MKMVLVLMALICSYASAGELFDIKMPDKDVVAGKPVVLNGMGYREVTVMMMPIKVYVAGLYLEKKSSDADEILSSKSVRQIRNTFKHRARESEVKHAWDESFVTVCKGDCIAKHKAHFDTFKAFFKTIKSDDTMFYNFLPTGLEIYQGTEKIGSIPDADFANLILSVWIGKNPVSEEMKKGLLGLH